MKYYCIYISTIEVLKIKLYKKFFIDKLLKKLWWLYKIKNFENWTKIWVIISNLVWLINFAQVLLIFCHISITQALKTY